MDDPDLHAMEEVSQIGVFEPGTYIEREVTWSRLSSVFIITLATYLLSVVATTILLFGLIGVGLVDIYASTAEEMFRPWSMVILTSASLTFVVGPYYYVRKHGLSSKTIGVRDMLSPLNCILGIGVGFLMFAGNYVFSWIITEVFSIPTGGDSLLMAHDIYELFGWMIVMFVFVGFTEEMLFRGFLQRRMEMYFKGRGDGTNAGWKALIITSFIFAVIHLDLIGLATRFMLGMLLGYLAQKTNYSLLGPSVAHGLNNAIVVVLLSVPF